MGPTLAANDSVAEAFYYGHIIMGWLVRRPYFRANLLARQFGTMGVCLRPVVLPFNQGDLRVAKIVGMYKTCRRYI
jgi:hypothetical protein